MFTEIFTKDPANVSLLLEVLEDADFYVRFNTVQLLNTLMGNTNALIDGIMASPMGVSRYVLLTRIFGYPEILLTRYNDVQTH